LYYRNPEHVGRFAKYPNVSERVITGRNKAVWDQVSIPLACRRDRLDVVLHPKFTVPILTSCRSVMVLHGAGWFIPENKHFWKPLDRAYIRTVMPLYCNRASAILSVSQVTTDVFNTLFGLPEGKIRTVYFGPGKQFKPIEDARVLDEVRRRYNLPERFIFTLSKYPGGDRKNIDGILKAYATIHDQAPHKLVVGGKDCDRFLDDYRIPRNGYGSDIVFPGYVSQEDLPAVYTLASLFLYPSKMEAFPIPITEAMACGAAIVTSDLNGLKEIAGDAALMVDAGNPAAIADGALSVLQNDGLRNSLKQRSLERSRLFSWEKCARETLEVLEGLKN